MSGALPARRLLGRCLGTGLPERAIKVFASLAFVVFGVLLVAEGLRILRLG